MAVRTNFVKADGLPFNFSDGDAIFKIFNSVGEVVNILATSPTCIIVAYNRRTAAEYAVFALDGQVTLQGNLLQVSLYVPANDPSFNSNPALKTFRDNIGKKGFSYDPASFTAFNQGLGTSVSFAAFSQGSGTSPTSYTPVNLGSNTSVTSSMAGQPSFGSMYASSIQLPNYSFNPSVNLRPSVFQPNSNYQGSGSTSFVSNFSSGTFLPNGALSSNGQSGIMMNGPSLGASAMDVSNQQSSAKVTGQYGEILSKHTKEYEPSDTSKDCNICLCELGTKETYDENSNRVLTLSGCGHGYHQACLEGMLKNSPSEFLQCPVCKKVHGVKTGIMPPGNISHRLIQINLSGYENFGTIEVTFNFHPGLQGPEHPNPGKYYQCVGFPRTAYLPDCDAGVRMLHGIYIAWQQRLMFTVGRSITTGRDNCVTWNDIHMKTDIGAGEHGYPDPAFLNNLAQDLAGFGITDSEISTHMAKNAALREKGHL